MIDRNKVLDILDSCINASCESCLTKDLCEWEPNQGLEYVRKYIEFLEQNWNGLKWAVLTLREAMETEDKGKIADRILEQMKELESRK